MSNFRISVTQIWHSGIPHIGTNSSRFLYSHEIFHLVNYFLLFSILFIYYFWNFFSGWGWNKTMFSWLSDQRYNFLVSKQIKKDFRTLVTYDHFLVISDKLKSHINFHKKTDSDTTFLFVRNDQKMVTGDQSSKVFFYLLWD